MPGAVQWCYGRHSADGSCPQTASHGARRRGISQVAAPRPAGRPVCGHPSADGGGFEVLDRSPKPTVFISADEPALGDTTWLTTPWDRARIVAGDAGKAGAVLALDDVQKITGWSLT